MARTAHRSGGVIVIPLLSVGGSVLTIFVSF